MSAVPVVHAREGIVNAYLTIAFTLFLAVFTQSVAQSATQENASSSSPRAITFNGRSLTPDQQQRLEALERMYRVRLPDLRYWYDNHSGAVGLWNGPALAALPAGLGFGGPMPANASLGGTGVFINGRELHPLDVAGLSRIVQVRRGRYWVDSSGYFG
jgi:hypothetical protein